MTGFTQDRMNPDSGFTLSIPLTALLNLTRKDPRSYARILIPIRSTNALIDELITA